MANEQNLVPSTDPEGHKLTSEDSAKGGRNSGKARRNRRTLKETLEYLATLKPTSKQVEDTLRQMGIPEEDINIGTAIAVKIMNGAQRGDHKAVREYMEGTGQKIIKNLNENHNIEYPPMVDLTKRPKNGDRKAEDGEGKAV